MVESQALLQEGKIFLGRSVEPEYLELRLANRHGLVTGATGTGKTVTLQVLAEGFSNAGVPVFAADIKGDLSGISATGEKKDGLAKRAKEIGLNDWTNAAFTQPCSGICLASRATRSAPPYRIWGRLLLARSDGAQRDAGGRAQHPVPCGGRREAACCCDLKDLRSMANDVGQRGKATHDQVRQRIDGFDRCHPAPRCWSWRSRAPTTSSASRRSKSATSCAPAADGRGFVNILAAEKLTKTPRLYATFLLWLLAQLFDKLPEVGDPDKPKLVFFFDEAHLLFSEAPKALLEQVERVTRLIRSKGVGVYYVTQNPRDVPNSVSAQLGNRVQHALRAFTPVEQKGIRAAAETFRPNPKLDVERVIQELKVGEALVSLLHGGGEPSMVQRTLIRPPSGRLGPVTAPERKSQNRGQSDLRQV